MEHSHIHALDGGNALNVGINEISETAKDRASATRSQSRPRRERIDGRGDGRMRGAFVAPRNLGQDQIPVERRTISEGTRALHSLPTDVVINRNVDGHPPIDNESQRMLRHYRSIFGCTRG